MTTLDIIIIIAYLVSLVLIGTIVSKNVKSHEDSVVAGRSFGALFAAIGKAANIAGGSTSVGGTGYGYTYGVSGSWFGLSNILSAFIMAPFANRLWKAMYRGHFTTIGEYVGYRFGTVAKVFAGGLNTLAYAGFVAAQVVATGTILAVLLGWDFKLAMVITTVVVIAYTVLGGLKAVVYTDIMQMGILYLGMVFILTPVSLGKVGGFSEMMARVPESFTQMGSMGAFMIIGVLLIPTALAPFTMQSTYAYTASCNSGKAATQSNILTSIIYAFPALAVIVIGMCAFLLHPGLASSQDALPTMILELLPTGLVGLLLAAILSATMSTSSTCLLCATNCFLTDVFTVFSKRERTLSLTRIVMVCVGALTLAISLFYPDIIGLIVLGYAVGAGGLLAPALATMFWKRATTAGCLVSMFVGGGVHVYIQLSQITTIPPVFFSIPLSAVLMVVVSLATKKPDPSMIDVYFDDEWTKSPKNPERIAG